MIYLIIGILCSSMLSILMRISEKYVKGNIAMLVVNYITCAVISALSIGPGNIFTTQDGIGKTVFIGVIAGALYLTGFVMLQYNIKKNGVVLPATFMKLGLLVSTAFSIIFFHERPDILQITGFIIAIAAIILINAEKDATAKLDFKLGLFILLFAAGMGDAMSKVFEETCPPALSDHYLLITFIVAGLLCFLVMLYNKQKIGIKEIVFGAVIGVPNYYSSLFVIKALETLDGVVVFPTFSVGCILVITTVGLFVFKEKLSKKQLVSLGMIMVALAMLNI